MRSAQLPRELERALARAVAAAAATSARLSSLTEAAAHRAGAALLLVRVAERVERRARRHAGAGGHGAAERVVRSHLGARLLQAEATRAVVTMHLPSGKSAGRRSLSKL